MVASVVTADVCSRLVESAARSCQPAVPVSPAQPTPNWDAIAASLASQSDAITWGATVLAIIVAVAGIGWGKITTRRAEREARKMAQKEVEIWLQDEGLPLVRREVNEFLRTFVRESPISEDEVAAMVAAAGDDGKEGSNGK